MKKILVIADKYDKKQPAIARAMTLAAKTQSAIEIVGFCYDNFVSAYKELDTQKTLQQTLIDNHKDFLESVVADIIKDNPDSASVSLSIDVVWEKRVADWVVDHVKKGDYSTVIKTGRRSESIIHTPLDWQLLRSCPVPLMVLARKSWKKKNRILCVLDLNTTVRSKRKLNEQIIEAALEQAELVNGEIHVAYTVEVPAILRDLDLVNTLHVKRDNLEAVMPYFQKLAKKYDLNEDNLHIKTGVVEKGVPSIANKIKADLVVLGTVGRKGLIGKVIGNSAEKILHVLRTDILAIKPE